MTQTVPGTTRTRLHELQAIGQSVWYDNIRRGLITSGELQRLVDAGVTGITSNPTIFEKAIVGSTDYDAALMTMLDREPGEIFEALAVEDIRNAADLLRPVYDRTGGRDGFVSIEVSPTLAHDTTATIAEARRLWSAVGRPNLMVKVPGTPAGFPAIAQLIGEGINVNVTLIFSLAAYERVMDAYLTGLERLAASGRPLDRAASVASFFVSRVDTAVDRRLDALARKTNDAELAERLGALRGQTAIANAVRAYQRFRATFAGARFAALAARGGCVQRPLWASTGTKDPAYSDIYYVESLAGPETVNTMPPQTVAAVLDHGRIASRLDDTAWADRVVAELAEVGVDLDSVTAELLDEGVASFAKSYTSLLAGVACKRSTLIAGQVRKQEAALGAEQATVEQTLADLEARRAAERIWKRDPTLWKEEPEHQREIKQRLGWLDVIATMREHVPDLEAFAEDVRAAGVEQAVLCGMGGSSLCPEVLRLTFGSAPGFPRLLVLDSTDPAMVLRIAEQADPARSLYLIASKSGTTIEVDALYRFFYARAQSALGVRAGEHFVAITDPGTPLERLAHERGFRRAFLNPPDIGGRYSALSLFGLVPAALLGLDLRRMLDRAEGMHDACAACVPARENPGVRLGAVLGGLAQAGRDKLVLRTSPQLASFGLWVEQLVAESTGKEGRGIVPVVGDETVKPGPDRLFVLVRLTGDDNDALDRLAAELTRAGQPFVTLRLDDHYDLGAEFFRWEFATAVAGVVLKINPFDQPNVQESKEITSQVLAELVARPEFATWSPAQRARALLADSTVVVTGPQDDAALSAEARTLLEQAHPGDYLAILAYVDMSPENDRVLAELRRTLGERTGLPVTLGYGPRFLHSTGQLHKGGPNSGVFLQITASSPVVVPIPGKPYDFGTLELAQASGDFRALQRRGRRAHWVHLERDVPGGLAQVAAAFR